MVKRAGPLAEISLVFAEISVKRAGKFSYKHASPVKRAGGALFTKEIFSRDYEPARLPSWLALI